MDKQDDSNNNHIDNEIHEVNLNNDNKNIGEETEIVQHEPNSALIFNKNETEAKDNDNSVKEKELDKIRQKIKKENLKILEINSQLDQLFKDNKKNSRNKYIDNSKSKSIISPSSQIKSKAYKLTVEPLIDSIYKKMENMKKIRLEKIDLSEKKLNSNLNFVNPNLKNLYTKEKEITWKDNIQLFRKNELEREKQRKKIINQINSSSRSQINKYIPKKNYITADERDEIRKANEEAIFKLEKEKRRIKYLPVTLEEINYFSNEVQKNEKILKDELGKKKKKMEELWKERKELLPKYHSKFFNLNLQLDNEAKNEINIIKEKLKNKDLERANFGKEIIKYKQPRISNDKLKSERLERIKILKGPNFNDIKTLDIKLKQRANQLVQSQPKNFSKKNVFIKKETIVESQLKKLTGKPVDYLLNCRNEKSKRDLNELAQSSSEHKVKKWKNMLDAEGNQIINNVERIKLEAEIMDKKANFLQQRMRQQPKDSPEKVELNIEASNLYLDSIKAKLQILDKIAK